MNCSISFGMSRLGTHSVALTQLETKYLEEFMKLNPADSMSRNRLDQLKKDFAELAVSAGYVD